MTTKKPAAVLASKKGATSSKRAASKKGAGSSNNPAEIQFLFRFRDLIADTITEHQNIISEKGACYWGWWKRPNEDARMDVWGKLKEQTERGQVRVGLFHSGKGIVYVAWISQVILPQRDDTPPTLPSPDKKLVPSYYRKSPFSRAWMRIEKIEPTPIAFFGEYSFNETPRLSFYGEEVLAQFKGKVIISPDELRGMDTTIWSVRKKASGDLDKEILLTTGALSTPVSREVIDLQSNAILHITDPHFIASSHHNQHIWKTEGAPGNKSTLAEAIERALHGQTIGLVVVTGDLTFTGSPEEFSAAAHSLLRLAGILNLDPSRFVIIPGNHDIQWAGKDNFEENAEVKEASDDAMRNYKEFYRTFFRHEPSSTLAMGRRFLLPCGVAVEICGLNSSSLETNKNFLAGMGRIQESAFETVANTLKWTNTPPEFALRVLATHHHLTLTENLEPAQDYYRGFGIAIDAPRIMRLAAKNGVHLVLHGHKHRAFIWRSGVYELPEHAHTEWHLGDISILGGGSAGSTSTESANNYFNVIDVSSKGLDVSIYRATNAGAFGRMQVWNAGIELTGKPPRLKLGDWEKIG